MCCQLRSASVSANCACRGILTRFGFAGELSRLAAAKVQQWSPTPGDAPLEHVERAGADEGLSLLFLPHSRLYGESLYEEQIVARMTARPRMHRPRGLPPRLDDLHGLPGRQRGLRLPGAVGPGVVLRAALALRQRRGLDGRTGGHCFVHDPSLNSPSSTPY